MFDACVDGQTRDGANMITTIVRTLNSQLHIERFCQSYWWVDKILVADGGSKDKTIEIASRYSNVEVRPFTQWIEKNGFGRNPECKHINFLVDWALSLNPDWITFDDVDSVPTCALQTWCIDNLSHVSEDILMVLHMYIYGTDKWFMGLTGNTMEPESGWNGLWAWRPKANMRWRDDKSGDWDPQTTNPHLVGLTRRDLTYPYALLHYFCLNEEVVQDRIRRYKAWNIDPDPRHPTEKYGPLSSLPGWAHA